MFGLVAALFIACITAKGCCLPDAWEGLAHGFDKEKNESFFEAISWDAKMEAFRADFFEDFRGQKHFHHQSIFLLRDRRDNKLKSYVYDRRANSCTTKTDSKPFPKLCIQENHHQEFKFTIGLGYPVVWYGFRKEDRRMEQVVSEHGCAPVSGAFISHHKLDVKIDYFDVRLGIGNPIVFELPAACL